MRLRTKQQYRRMSQKSTKFVGKWILVDAQMTSHAYARLGITVTKKYGNSPQRNRFKRLVRESFRLSSFLKVDVVVRPRSKARQAKMQDIKQELIYFISKLTAS